MNNLNFALMAIITIRSLECHVQYRCSLCYCEGYTDKLWPRKTRGLEYISLGIVETKVSSSLFTNQTHSRGIILHGRVTYQIFTQFSFFLARCCNFSWSLSPKPLGFPNSFTRDSVLAYALSSIKGLTAARYLIIKKYNYCNPPMQ